MLPPRTCVVFCVCVCVCVFLCYVCVFVLCVCFCVVCVFFCVRARMWLLSPSLVPPRDPAVIPFSISPFSRSITDGDLHTIVRDVLKSEDPGNFFSLDHVEITSIASGNKYVGSDEPCPGHEWPERLS